MEAGADSPSFSDATATDSDGDEMTYSWSVQSSPSGAVADTDYTLSNDTSLTGVSFTATKSGTYTLKLTVSDGTTSAIDTVTVTGTSTYAKGDINGQGGVTLADAIMGLQILTGQSVTGIQILAVVTDNKVGIVEVIYILKSLAATEI